MDELTELLCAARDGDRFALGAFVRRTQPEVWRLCAHLTSPQDADDLAQEAYLRAWVALERYRAEAPARVWLLTIVRRVCADAIRSWQRRRRRERWFAFNFRPTALPVAADASGRIAVEQLLQSLDFDQRVALVLTRLIGLSYAEAAEVCGCAVGTIRSRVARARSDLLELLDDTDQPGAADQPRS